LFLGPPADSGVSREHAKLIAGPDGNWSVVDLGSTSGTLVNGSEITPGEAVPLRDGDRLNLGAWTMITMTRSWPGMAPGAGRDRGHPGQAAR
jgi:predicted component of type VI protein secretion system